MTSTAADYHGIIVKEGIRDQRIFHHLQILGRRIGKQWTLLKVGVSAKDIANAIRLVQENLLTENGVPYYAHMYRNDELIVVFPRRIFRISPEKSTWKEAVSYGESLRIPTDELDFKPCKSADETF